MDGDMDSLPAALSWAVGLAFSHTSRERGKKQVLAVQLADGTHKGARWRHSPAKQHLHALQWQHHLPARG